MGTKGKTWATATRLEREKIEQENRRRFEFIKAFFPADPMAEFRRDSTFRMLHLVTRDDLVKHPPVDVGALPNGYWVEMQQQRNFSGVSLRAVEQYGIEAHFIRIWDVLMMNPAVRDQYPVIDSCSIEQLMDEESHWIWGGSWRTVPLVNTDGTVGVGMFHPQATYQAHTGQWRKIAASTLLLGRGWENRCVYCGPGCLKPDHWRNMTSWAARPGKGREPHPERTTPRRKNETETQPETE